MTESLALVFVLIMLGAATRIAIHQDIFIKRTHIIYYMAYLLAIWTRHSLAVLGMLLPLFYLAMMVSESKISKRRTMQVFSSIIIGISIIFTAHIGVVLLKKVIGGSTESIFGRAVVYRMEILPWSDMPKKEREFIIKSIKDKTNDPLVKKAIDIMIISPNPWVGAYSAINDLPENPKTEGETDRIMNSAAKAFFLTPNKYLVKDVFNTFINYIIKNRNLTSQIAFAPKSIERYQNNPTTPQVIRELPIVRNSTPTSYKWLTIVFKPQYSKWLLQPLIIISTTFLILFLATKFKIMKYKIHPLLFSLFTTGFVLLFLTSIITEEIPRYIVANISISWAMLGITIAAIGKKT